MPPAKSAKKSRITFFLKEERSRDVMISEVTTSAMNNFMAGSALTGSNVYTRGIIYLKTKILLNQCSQEDRNNTINDKWGITIN